MALLSDHILDAKCQDTLDEVESFFINVIDTNERVLHFIFT